MSKKNKNLRSEEENYSWLVRSVKNIKPDILISEALRSPKLEESQAKLLRSYKSFVDRAGFLTVPQKRVISRIYLDLHRPENLKAKTTVKKVKPLKFIPKCHAVRLPDEEFYKTKNWLDLKERMFEVRSPRCSQCKMHGSKETLSVLHIKSRLLYPELSLSKLNLKLLCENCVPVKLSAHPKPILRKCEAF